MLVGGQRRILTPHYMAKLQRRRSMRPGFLGRIGNWFRNALCWPTPIADDLLAGTGIFESEDDWTLLESGWSVSAGALQLAQGNGGTLVARWKPSINPLTAETGYTVSITIENDIMSQSGASMSFMGGTSIFPTHTSGTQEYAITSGTSTSAYIIEVRENQNNFTSSGVDEFDNSMTFTVAPA